MKTNIHKRTKNVLVPIAFHDTQENKRTKIAYAMAVAKMLGRGFYILHFEVKAADQQDVENSLKLLCFDLGIGKEEVKIVYVPDGVKSKTINWVCKDVHADCVVMGTDKLPKKLFWGNDGTFDLINALDPKVFVVPSGAVFSPPKKIVVPFDNSFHMQKIPFTVSLATANQAKITIFCESNPRTQHKASIKLGQIKDYLSTYAIGYCVEVARNRDKSYAHHLMKYALKNGDLLVLEHDGIFKKTKKLIEEFLFSEKFSVVFVKQKTTGKARSFNG